MISTSKIAIIGGGPSALFLFKRLIDSENKHKLDITIFEKNNFLGMGMPYSRQGANDEHITNVSDNEIPEVFQSMEDWIKEAPESLQNHYGMQRDNFNPYKVVPRLLFGQYLADQFDKQLEIARTHQIKHRVQFDTEVIDIQYHTDTAKVTLSFDNGSTETFDQIVICTGHRWPKPNEETYTHFFDSPYPPIKLKLQVNKPVAITGCSLSAVDAIRTLSRSNGYFEKSDDGQYTYHLNEQSEGFKIVLHSLHGLFPGLRFHLKNTHLTDDALLTEQEILEHIDGNDGYLSLDFIFEKNFKRILRKRDPETYQKIQNLSLEECAAHWFQEIDSDDPIEQLEEDQDKATQSIRRKKSLHWREIMAMLSFTLNFPAKYLSAEDKLRLDEFLKPLMSHVLAFIPQGSVRELIALADAGLLELKKVDAESYVEPHPDGGATYFYHDDEGNSRRKRYHYYVNAIGQKLFDIDEFPFRSLLDNGAISQATFQFRDQNAGKKYQLENQKSVTVDDSGNFQLLAKGLKINDHFQIVNQEGEANTQIFLMAVPYMGGYNPDYSGLDFAEAASLKITEALLEKVD